MDVLTDIFDEVELICHQTMWSLSCDESIREWNKKSKQITIKNKKSRGYPWHKSRCGFMINNKYCEHKSHFSGLYKRQIHDVDICDRGVFCFIHKKYEYSEYEKQKIRMEKIIIERIKNQKEFFITDVNKDYLERLKEKIFIK
jgi:hypothetical protein